MNMSSYELIYDLQVLLTAFQDPIFLMFTLILAITAAYGVKKLILE